MKAKLQPPDSRNPTCFGMHYSAFFRFFVYFNMLQNMFCVGLVTYEITIMVQVLQVLVVDPLDEKIKLYMRAFAWAWFVVQCIVSFGLDVHLARTATKPSLSFLRFYALLHALSLSLFFIWYYTLLIIGGSILPYPPTLGSVLLPVHVLYRVYTSYIVFRYSRDIAWELSMQCAFRNLTDSEVLYFELGMAELEGEDALLRMKDQLYSTCYDMAMFEKYNKEYEIPLEKLDFSESSTLGCGEYGCVYKAHLLQEGKDKEGSGGRMEVAVKTVDPELSDVNHFKALLTEAKVMTFMGRHENIVQLIGICTEEIRERKLYIVCELCTFGNLLAHLRSERNTFVDLISGSGTEEESDPGALSTRDLVKWAGEIASGMEFLANKKIIHGDLAARNVLLTSNRSAKITDFGLSRKLYSYTVYTKRANVPLPWRWLALESLIDMDFSSSSDVWMYGILLWEIFELGRRPWPDVQVFCSEFIQRLKDGKRMEQPMYCDKEIYEMMLACWREEPSARPTFSELNAFFRNAAKNKLLHNMSNESLNKCNNK